MSEFAPWMFLVRVQEGDKPRVYRVSPYEAIAATNRQRLPLIRRREARAWKPAVDGGEAAIGNTVSHAYDLIEKLRHES